MVPMLSNSLLRAGPGVWGEVAALASRCLSASRAMAKPSAAKLSVYGCHPPIEAPRDDFAGLAMDGAKVMGIVNVTPDSFSDGGRHSTSDAGASHV